MDNGDENICTPEELREIANATSSELLPKKSKGKYDKAYQKFQKWKSDKNAPISENVMLTYFVHLDKIVSPPTLWSTYSMLKSTIKLYDNISIEKFTKVVAFVKRRNENYKPKKSKILTHENIEKFINDAPDDRYLAYKVCLIFGIMGGLRIDELTNVEVDHVEKHGNLLLVKVPITKTNVEKSFTITEEYVDIVQRYADLRPENVTTTRFFLQYRNEKCTNQPIGKNAFCKMPAAIATYLNLPDANLYTGHSFRRSSASLLANAGADIATLMRHGKWKSSAIAESYVENSVEYKKRTSEMITSAITLRTNSSNKEETEATRSNFEDYANKKPMIPEKNLFSSRKNQRFVCQYKMCHVRKSHNI